MKTSLKILLFSIILLFLSSCSSSKKSSTNKKPELENNLFFEGIFQNNSGIVYINNQKNITQQLLAVDNNFGQVTFKTSPDSKNIIFSFYDTKKQETYLYSLNIKLKKLALLKLEKGLLRANLFWDTNSQIISNFYATKQDKRTKLWDKYTGVTSIINIISGEIIRTFTPSKGAILEAHLQNKYLVYSNSNSFYILNKSNNKLVSQLKGFSTQNKYKSKLTFSPDGKHMFFIKTQNVKNRQGKTLILNSLYTANYNGKNRKEILEIKYNPKNISWTPNSKKIICDIASPKYSNARRIATYDIKTNKTGFNDSFNGSEENPIISSSGSFLLFTRKTPNQFNSTNDNYIIKTMASGSEKKIDVLIRYTPSTVQKFGFFDYWNNDSDLVFSNKHNFTIINLKESKYIQTPSDKWILFLKTIGANND